MKAVIFNLEGTLLAVREDAYELYDGVDDLLAILKRLGKTLVVHADANEPAARHLATTATQRHFTAYTATPALGDEPITLTSRLHRVLAGLDIAPADALFVGDGVADISAAKDAGMGRAVAVTHGVGSASDLRAAGADHVIDDIPSLLDVLE